MTYTVFLLVIPVSALASSVFVVANAQTVGEEAGFRTFTASYGGQSFDVKATIPFNGTIDNISVYPEYGTIYITLTMSSVGQQNGIADMKIILPRSLIDSKTNNTDSKYRILVDDEPTSYQETRTTASERELTFSVSPDSSDIEIFGKQIVPEFPAGIVAALAMCVAIVVIAAMGRNYTNNVHGTR